MWPRNLRGFVCFGVGAGAVKHKKGAGASGGGAHRRVCESYIIELSMGTCCFQFVRSRELSKFTGGKTPPWRLLVRLCSRFQSAAFCGGALATAGAGAGTALSGGHAPMLSSTDCGELSSPEGAAGGGGASSSQTIMSSVIRAGDCDRDRVSSSVLRRPARDVWDRERDPGDETPGESGRPGRGGKFKFGTRDR